MTSLIGQVFVDQSQPWPCVRQVILLTGLNLPVTLHYFGAPISLLYVAVLLVSALYMLRLHPSRQKHVVLIVLITSVVIQFCLLFLVAPVFDMRMDRDDALILWWQRILQGQYPYAEATSIGNPISILPGLHVLTFPFILLGNVGLVEIATFVMLSILIWNTYLDDEQIRVTTALALATAPLVMLEVAGRSDLILNATLLSATALVLFRFRYQKPTEAIITGIALGLLIGTRFALWPVLIPFGGYLLTKVNIRGLIRIALVAAAIAAVLIVPFVVWDSNTFFRYAPFGVNATKLSNSANVQLIWLGVTGATTVAATAIAYLYRVLFLPMLLVLSVVVVSTWLTFFYDVTYAQLLFVPALFLATERRPI